MEITVLATIRADLMMLSKENICIYSQDVAVLDVHPSLEVLSSLAEFPQAENMADKTIVLITGMSRITAKNVINYLTSLSCIH
jgi:hypothetical protein